MKHVQSDYEFFSYSGLLRIFPVFYGKMNSFLINTKLLHIDFKNLNLWTKLEP